MSDEETYSVIFASLKHPLRRKILRVLASGPKTFTEILQQLDIESAHLSYHLDGLDGLLKKTPESKYLLSDLGQAGLSLMARIEEPVRLVSPSFLKTTRHLRVARVSFFALAILGVLLIGNGVLAVSSINIQKSTVQTNTDSDNFVFEPNKTIGFFGTIYSGDGLYGLQVDLVMRDPYVRFPLVVRLSTPVGGPNSTAADYWDQSWYEWSRPDQAPVSGIREVLSVTLLSEGASIRIISQSSFDHVHPSPGQVIGQFRPTDILVLIRVAPEIGNANVTLSGFRAFQIKWLYFPQPEDNVKNSSFLLGSGLVIPSVGFILGSRYLVQTKERKGREDLSPLATRKDLNGSTTRP
jgi:DNA-binding transcriptional ArsR family regulator